MMHLSVERYRRRLEATFGFADEEMVKRYAERRKAWKQGNIDSGEWNVFTGDPECKTCKKKKK